MAEVPNGSAARETSSALSAWLLAVAAIAVAVAIRYEPILGSLGTHFADFDALHAGRLINELPDTRLNSWILAWVQRAALTAPSSIFDGNIFHPAPGVITGSEHLFGVALQMAPFRLFTSNAIALHQLALVISALILGLTSFAAVRGATRSLARGPWPAVVAGALAVWMPWRVTELSHLQLSSAQFFPILWWWTLRSLDEDVPVRVRVALAVGTTIQLLSSFYLAYFLTLSTGLLVVLACAIGAGRAERWRRLPRLAMSLAPAYALFGLTGLPYLAKRASDALEAGYDPAFSLGIAGAWHLVAPRWPHAEAAAAPLNAPAVYDIPYGVALLGLLALGIALRSMARQRDPLAQRDALAGGELPAHTASAALGFASIALLGFVFAIGGSLDVAGLRIPLPTYFLSQVVPGFDMLRGPGRWSILVGLSFPLLAGIGIAWLDARTSGSARWISRCALALLLLASTDLFRIPVAPAWQRPDLVARHAEAIRALPDPAASLVELPIGHGFTSGLRGSRSALASTLHWRRILNGYTGHAPPSYAFLRSLTRELPDARAVDELRKLSGLRWASLDLGQLPAERVAAWERAEREGRVRTHAVVGRLRIVDLSPHERDRADAGIWVDALIDATPRSTTFAGLPRTALALGDGAGRLEVRRRGPMLGEVDDEVEVRIRNRSGLHWPGFDIQREGLVMLRYTVAAPGASTAERAAATRLSLLKRDVAPGETARIRTFLRPPRPAQSGPAELCVDLVQWRGGNLLPLPVPPVRQPVRLDRRDDATGLQDLIALYTIPPAPLPPCGLGG